MLPQTAGWSMLPRALAILTMFASVCAARGELPPGVNPLTDPANDPLNPLGYITNNGLTAMAVAITLIIAVPQTWFTWRIGGRFMLAMVIAEYTYALGIAFRFGMHSNPDSLILYVMYNLFVTLSPCGFIAAEYVLLGRLARWVHGDRHLLISPRRITLVFVCSDVATFLTQAGGGSISASAGEDVDKAKIGSRVFLIGLILQLVSFVFFMCVYLLFLVRMYKHEPEVWARDRNRKWYNDWRALAGAMWVSCIGILVRSVYRSIELSEGYNGRLTRTEIYFFVLDFVPLIVAMVCYVPFWPGRFIPNDIMTRYAPVTKDAPREPSTDETIQLRVVGEKV